MQKQGDVKPTIVFRAIVGFYILVGKVLALYCLNIEYVKLCLNRYV
jgi:hypothetical protein